jgi:peptidoglycan/xylan/chitin deacetylase (PgdA/CDA1 family)
MTLLFALGLLVFAVIPLLLGTWLAVSVYLECRKDRIPVLLYHRLIAREAAVRGVVADDEMIWASYDDSFAEQAAYLKREGYTTLDFDDYLSIRRGEKPLPARPVIITFDDGYESVYKHAFPPLREHGLKATVFVVPEPDQHSRELIAGVDDFLTEDQAREMASAGIELQSHTLTHAILTELDDEAVTHELEESKRRIRAITDRPVRHLAVPRAAHSRRIERLARAAGYETACCNNKGTANGRTNPMAIPRVVVERDMSLEEFAACMRPAMGITLRVVGNIKRIPERLGGSRFSYALRGLIYRPRLQFLFKLSTLKWIVAAGVLLYLAGAVVFWVRVLSA